MDASEAARTALYGMGGRPLLEEAVLRYAHLNRLEALGREKAERVLAEGRAPDQGYLVVTARNKMRDALRLLREIDLGRRGPSHDDRLLHDRLRPADPEGWAETMTLRRDAFSAFLRDWDRGKPERGLGDCGPPLHPADEGRGYSPRIEPKRELDLSTEAYKVANELLTLKERQVIDGTLAGKTQTEIAAYIGHQQPYVSKLFHQSMEKLIDSGHPELEALGWQLRVIGRESKRQAVV